MRRKFCLKFWVIIIVNTSRCIYLIIIHESIFIIKKKRTWDNINISIIWLNFNDS